MAVQRIYVEKRPEHAVEAKGLLAEFRGLLGVKGLTGLRILNRYDVEGMAPEQFRQAVPVVFSEPQLDEVYPAIPQGEFTVFATEYLPGQFDRRACSCFRAVSAKPSLRPSKNMSSTRWRHARSRWKRRRRWPRNTRPPIALPH